MRTVAVAAALVLAEVLTTLDTSEAQLGNPDCYANPPQEGVPLPTGDWFYYPAEPMTFEPEKVGFWRDTNRKAGLQTEECLVGGRGYTTDTKLDGPTPPAVSPPTVPTVPWVPATPTVPPVPTPPPVLDDPYARCLEEPPQEGLAFPEDPTTYLYAPTESPASLDVTAVGLWKESNPNPGLQTRECRQYGMLWYKADTQILQWPEPDELLPPIPDEPPTVTPPNLTTDPPTVPDPAEIPNCVSRPPSEGLPSPTGPRDYLYYPLPRPLNMTPEKMGFWVEVNNQPGLQTEDCRADGFLWYRADRPTTPCLNTVESCVAYALPLTSPCARNLVVVCGLPVLPAARTVTQMQPHGDTVGNFDVDDLTESPYLELTAVPVLRGGLGHPAIGYLRPIGPDAEAIITEADLPRTSLLAERSSAATDAVPFDIAMAELKSARLRMAASGPVEGPVSVHSYSIALYPDPILQSKSYWARDAQLAMDQTQKVLWENSGIDLAFAIYMPDQFATRFGTDDIATRCELMEVGDYELSRAQRAPVAVVMSSGEKLDGHFGEMINGPLMAQVDGEQATVGGPRTWYDHCHSAFSAQMRLPTLYIHDEAWMPSWVVSILFAHEVAHAFEMRHTHADCYYSPQHGTVYKTIEAATSDTTSAYPPPASCGHYLDGTYGWDVSDTTAARMREHSSRWYGCDGTTLC